MSSMWHENVQGRFLSSSAVAKKEPGKGRAMKPLNGRLILICGKVGSEKSTIFLPSALNEISHIEENLITGVETRY